MHRSMFGQLIIDCDDLEAGVNFWTSALAATIGTRHPPYVFLKTPEGTPPIALQAVPESKRVKNRMHLDIFTDDLEAEVQRLEALGATRQQQQERWWVMNDPCGNEFCVIRAQPANFDTLAQTWPG